jgi:hypothetical protein
MSPLPVRIALAIALHAAGVGNVATPRAEVAQPAAATPSPEVREMKLRLTIGSRALTATLLASETSRDFASLLPLTLTMNDLFGREKYGHLPRPLSGGGNRAHVYEVGQIAYWAPGPDVAIFYRHDGQRIPEPGIVILGTIDAGVEALAVPGSTKVKIELVK